MPLIEARKLTRLFKAGGGIFGKKKYLRAVDGVSFSIGESESISLVGESGCGKTTLGRLILGIIKPSSGQVLYRGNDVWKLGKAEFRSFRRNAQIIHQDPYTTLNPMRTIYQSLSAPLLRYKITKEPWETSADLLKAVGLEPPEDFLNRYPCRLSGGQMQRVAIARAISVSPEFIVADEAVSMLDASLRVGVIDTLLDLRKKFGIAYLFVTHDFAMARYFAQGGNVMVMYLGSIVEIGDTEDVTQKPLHPYTKTLLMAVSVPDPKLTRQRGLPQLKSLEIPRLTEMPSGCKFHPRCPYAENVCTKEVPELREVGSGHLVACHIV